MINASVSAATTDFITGLSNTGVSGLSTVLPIAGVLIVTAALVFWVIRHFRAIARI